MKYFLPIQKKTFLTQGKYTTITSGGNEQVVPDDPFELVNHALSLCEVENNDLPFVGGALGFLSYDLGRRIEKIPNIASDDVGIPEMAMGIYHWAYISDHHEKKIHFSW